MRDLGALQRAFHAIVIGAAPLASARDLVIGGAVDPTDRMRVYVHAYFARIRDALAADFPKLVRVLGDDGFAAAAEAYLQACPPRHWSLREAGDRLAGFFAGDARWPPWLADLARLERARVDAFDAEDAVPLGRDDLQHLAPEAFSNLALPLVPSAQLVALGHAADDVWSAIEDDAPWAAPGAAPRHVVVWRRDLAVIHRTVAPDEAVVLGALAGGASFAEACAALADHPAPAERALELALQALDGGLIRRPSSPITPGAA